jgi:hypothetical protein
MIGLMTLVAVVQSAQPNLESRRSASIAIPSEIASAVIPYLQCVVGDEQGRIIGVSTGEATRAGVQLLLNDCRSVREVAETRSRQMLRSTNYPAGERERMIADTLSAIDHSHDNIADHLDRVNARLNAAKETNDAAN